jgi:hypothetical protein
MGFEYTPEYFERKIQLIERAITGTNQAMSELTDQRQIDAHLDQIKSHESSLKSAIRDFEAFKSIPPACSMCEIRAGRCHGLTKRLSKNCIAVYRNYAASNTFKQFIH